MRVTTPRRHSASADNRWIKSLARGGVAAVIACALVGGTIAAAGRVLAVSVDARSDTRSLLGIAQPQRRFASLALPIGAMVTSSLVDASPELEEDEAPNGTAAFSIASSGTLPDLSDDFIFTGSIARQASRFDSRENTFTGRFEIPSAIVAASEVARRFPLPRMRPQLVSLAPVPKLGLEPEREESTLPAKTAIYDITAKVVYMPNGDKLEAHSGFGQFMDDPRHMRVRMRGVTPPNTYKLTMREALFHGVEAIRLTPLDQSAMFGRAGILAHPYMLGPNGQSNGCVSFKDYPKFLAAFKRGEVERMVVVVKMDKPPVYARRNIKSAANTL